MNKGDPLLRAEVEAAVLAAFERDGPRYSRGDIVKQYHARGASRATLFRWVEAVATSGLIAERMVHRLSHLEPAHETLAAAAAARVVADRIGAAMPPVVRLEQIGSAGGTISVVEKLQRSMALATQIIRQVTNPDGTIRLTKTALAASEHNRRCLETAVRMAEAMREISKVDEFHAALIEEVAKESPACAERILGRLHHFTAKWNRGF